MWWEVLTLKAMQNVCQFFFLLKTHSCCWCSTQSVGQFEKQVWQSFLANFMFVVLILTPDWIPLHLVSKGRCFTQSVSICQMHIEKKKHTHKNLNSTRLLSCRRLVRLTLTHNPRCTELDLQGTGWPCVRSNDYQLPQVHFVGIIIKNMMESQRSVQRRPRQLSDKTGSLDKLHSQSLWVHFKVIILRSLLMSKLVWIHLEHSMLDKTKWGSGWWENLAGNGDCLELMGVWRAADGGCW